MFFLPSHSQASSKSAKQQPVQVLLVAVSCVLSTLIHSFSLTYSIAYTRGSRPCSFSQKHVCECVASYFHSDNSIVTWCCLLACSASCSAYGLVLTIARRARNAGGSALDSRGAVPHLRGDGVPRGRQPRGLAAEGGARGTANGSPAATYPRSTFGRAVQTDGGAGRGRSRTCAQGRVLTYKRAFLRSPHHVSSICIIPVTRPPRGNQSLGNCVAVLSPRRIISLV